ncbi:MAG: hypothetical protein WAP54_00990, partial [Bacteroidales bacterium]
DMDQDTILYRLENHEEKGHKVVDFYKQQNKIVSFNGNQDEDDLFEEISETIEKAFKEIRK